MALRPELPASPAQPTVLARLRHELSAIESVTGVLRAHHSPVEIGIDVIDTALGGALVDGSVHEIAAVRESETAIASGFTLALAVRSGRKSGQCPAGSPEHISPQPKTVIWITEDLGIAESGLLYGPGLDQTGIFPEHVITVSAPHGRDALWAMEEALRCRALNVVISEVRTPRIEHVITRRLSLAAAAGNTLGFLIRTMPDDEPSACATRWLLGAAPSAFPLTRFQGIGPPRWMVNLARNRRGYGGTWIVEWNSVEQRFELAKNPQPMAGAVFNRPYRTTAA